MHAEGKVLFALGSYKTVVLVDVPQELPDKLLRETLARFGEIIGLHRYSEQVCVRVRACVCVCV
jgi:hypothetical protein